VLQWLLVSPGEEEDLASATAKWAAWGSDARPLCILSDVDVEPLEMAGMTAVIPPKGNRNNPTQYDRVLYERRRRIESSSAG
jgi:hypothetical protein